MKTADRRVAASFSPSASELSASQTSITLSAMAFVLIITGWFLS